MAAFSKLTKAANVAARAFACGSRELATPKPGYGRTGGQRRSVRRITRPPSGASAASCVTSSTGNPRSAACFEYEPAKVVPQLRVEAFRTARPEAVPAARTAVCASTLRARVGHRTASRGSRLANPDRSASASARSMLHGVRFDHARALERKARLPATEEMGEQRGRPGTGSPRAAASGSEARDVDLAHEYAAGRRRMRRRACRR